MAMKTPMLSKQDAVPPPVAPVPTAEATLITSAHDALEAKATSLRRAATALLFFGMICARPCPSAWGAWLAIMSGIAVLCSSGPKLLCRTRFSRFLAVFTAIFAGITLVSLIQSYRAGMPLQIAAKFHQQCDSMPKTTFEWTKSMVVEHKPILKGLSFLSRHMPNETSQLISSPYVTGWSYGGSEYTDLDVNATSLPAVKIGSVEPEKWSQSEACDKLSHFVACFAKMMTVGYAFAHLFLLLSAVAVVKRACRLRYAAYRAGLLKWKCCKSACKRAEPVQAIVTPAPTTAKEMA